MLFTNLLTSSLGKLRDIAVGATKGAVGATKGAACASRSVAGGVASQLAARVPGLERQRNDSPVSGGARRPEPMRPAPSPAPRPHGEAVAPAVSQVRPTAAPDQTPAERTAAAAADKAPANPAPVRQAPAKRAPAKKAAAKKAPARKVPGKKAPGRKAAVTEPALRSAAQDEVVYTTETAGTPASPDEPPAPPAPGEETLIDPGTARQIAKEAERGLRDAEPS